MRRRAVTTMKRRDKGFTLIEVMIAVGVLALMMVIAWGTVVQTMRANKHFGAVEDRYREARNALAKMVADIQTAYISGNEDRTQQEPRTFFIGDASGDIGSLRFSSFAHTRLYADANESDQTIVAYFSGPDPFVRGQTDVMRRETRRMPNPQQGEKWDSVAGETDILFAAASKLKITYFDNRDQSWKESWSSQGADGGANRTPDRVKISLSFVDEEGKEITLTTQAKVYMQEMLQFYAN
jgi:general secretion pathway protein J